MDHTLKKWVTFGKNKSNLEKHVTLEKCAKLGIVGHTWKNDPHFTLIKVGHN